MTNWFDDEPDTCPYCGETLDECICEEEEDDEYD